MVAHHPNYYNSLRRNEGFDEMQGLSTGRTKTETQKYRGSEAGEH